MIDSTDKEPSDLTESYFWFLSRDTPTGSITFYDNFYILIYNYLPRAVCYKDFLGFYDYLLVQSSGDQESQLYDLSS